MAAVDEKFEIDMSCYKFINDEHRKKQIARKKAEKRRIREAEIAEIKLRERRKLLLGYIGMITIVMLLVIAEAICRSNLI